MLAQKEEEAAILKRRWLILCGNPGKVGLHAGPRAGVFGVGRCRVLDLARSGYFAWKRRGERPRDVENRRLDADIRRFFYQHQARYGAPRLTLDLRAAGWTVSRQRVAQRMRAMGLRARATRNYKATTQPKHSLPVARTGWGRASQPRRPTVP